MSLIALKMSLWGGGQKSKNKNYMDHKTMNNRIVHTFHIASLDEMKLFLILPHFISFIFS